MDTSYSYNLSRRHIGEPWEGSIGHVSQHVTQTEGGGDWKKRELRVKIPHNTLTRLGMNGGGTFLASRSSQLMDKKKVWPCSSAYKQSETARQCVYGCVCLCGLACMCQHSVPGGVMGGCLQGHVLPQGVWYSLSPAGPAAETGQTGTHFYGAAGGCEGCSQTSRPYCDCRTGTEEEREREKRRKRREGAR